MQRKFTDEQMFGILKIHEAGFTVKDFFLKHGISDASHDEQCPRSPFKARESANPKSPAWELMRHRAGIRLGIDYPKPMVDLKQSRERALAAFRDLT